MSVIRSVKDRENPYVQINKCIFQDEKLSLKAKGLLGYCLSKKDNWVFHVFKMEQELKESKNTIYAIINECISQGYAYRHKIVDDKGKIVDWETIVSDSKEEINKVKEEIELKKINPLPNNADLDNPDLGFPDLESCDTSNKSSSVKNESSEEQQQQGASPAAVSSKKQTQQQEPPEILDCLKSLDIPQSDKVWLSCQNPKDVENAVAYATHPETKIKKSLSQAIKWAVKEKPEIPKGAEDIKKDNVAWAKQSLKEFNVPKNVNVEFFNKYLEIDSSFGLASGSYQPITLGYDELGFKDQFENALRKIGARKGLNV